MLGLKLNHVSKRGHRPALDNWIIISVPVELVCSINHNKKQTYFNHVHISLAYKYCSLTKGSWFKKQGHLIYIYHYLNSCHKSSNTFDMTLVWNEVTFRSLGFQRHKSTINQLLRCMNICIIYYLGKFAYLCRFILLRNVFPGIFQCFSLIFLFRLVCLIELCTSCM